MNDALHMHIARDTSHDDPELSADVCLPGH